MASMADQADAVAEFMETLNEHRKNCEALGRYVEAEIARKRLDELRAHEESRAREGLRARQLAELLAVEEAHMMEFQQFNGLQDAKMAAFEMNAQALMDALRTRHADELRDFQQRLLATAGAPKHSKEYLTLRDVQEKLAHGKNYAGAAKIKAKADELMAYEEEAWGNAAQAGMVRKEELFKRKLGAEAEALKKRIATGRAEVNRARQVELERLLQRYHNVKEEAEGRHRGARLKMERDMAVNGPPGVGNVNKGGSVNSGSSRGGGGGGGGGAGKGGGAARGGKGAGADTSALVVRRR
jgi:hypothetical protein